MASVRKSMMKCSNTACDVTGNATLFKCARCRATRYCSKECQKAHWKTHKELCNKNAAHAEELKAAPPIFNSLPLPDGITITELDTRLEKWIAFHNPTLMGATIHALGLPRDLNRCRTHVLKMKVRPRYDHGGSPGKYFRVEEAEPIEVSKAMSFPAPWPEALADLVTLRVEQEQSGRGTVAAIGIFCPPLPVQIVPFGSLQKQELSSLQVVSHWKDTLNRDVENGRKFTRFG